jgi:two-component SAPR family response regulator
MGHFKYLVVDDDTVNNYICRIIIHKVVPEAEVVTFLEPEHGLDYLQNLAADSKPVVLFLDINMPTMTGWEFMTAFARFDNSVKERVNIFILSSSLDHRDIEKANSNIFIKGYLSKPLTAEMVKAAG